MWDYDGSVAFLGTWGRFQLMVFFLLCSTILPNGTGSFSLVFITDTPRHRCRITEVNLSQEWREAAVPLEVVDGEPQPSRCRRYRLDLLRNLSAGGLLPGLDVNLSSLEQEDCVDGWVYGTEVYQSTVVSEFDLVCSQRWKQPFTATIFFLGVLVGSFFSGVLADRFGRKVVLFSTIMIQAVFTLVQIAAPSWEVFCFFLFCSGLGNISNYVSCFILGTEILTGNARVIYSSAAASLGFTLGYMMLPLFAYFLRSWKTLLLAIGLPGLFYIPLWWVLPESPMWLLSQGRVMEAEAIVKKAAKMNRLVAPEKIFGDFELNANEESPVKRYTILDLVTKRSTAMTTVLLCWVWFTLNICYFGLSLNTSHLHADPYISCFLSAVVEMPAYVSCSLAIRYLPRRLAVVAAFLTMGLALLFIQLVPQSILGLAVALEMLGKFAATAGTSLLYAFTAELYPTGLRNTASGTCVMVSRTGSCLAPFLIQMSKHFSGKEVGGAKHSLTLTVGTTQTSTSSICRISPWALWPCFLSWQRSSCQRRLGDRFPRPLNRCKRGKNVQIHKCLLKTTVNIVITQWLLPTNCITGLCNM
ncbi:solute carrier family 22 member 4-like isoform X1 [Phyllopteryx taeniolatus]|uniref:solute carrier family 22 member 4-like isoform X1 n=1 Tax=Phyllopteryx taeniolatus TaxID=161469 RepID=UPI002AD4DC93|nr:solute carrier family 22 member 4-like isoform X1 [Phyllopteryx taeniolatus]XP_061606954.1 solute carrier family 22 member 4-like isoform X1 [Phyllopteryx taeniolatus]XP_061606955.1 solute carrier family 22 member 4-like isoform X1 [Phyllopteryx taeniolatus]